MLKFVPNIVIMEYLTALNKLTPEIKEKIKTFTESGYQTQLTYKHDDGSYSVFGKHDDSGSTWLTAFVAKSFYEASKFIAVDEKMIIEALDFLAKVQTEDGNFPEVGHVSYTAMQGGASKGLALTAYTLITFLENQNLAKNYQTTIDKALSFVLNNAATLHDDNYALAITTYALQISKHPLRHAMLAKLEEKAENKDGFKHWSKEIPKSEEDSPWWYQPNSVNVEMSAYGLQAFVEAGQEVDAVPILKWLLTQRNEEGGFQSTQDTVVGLQALAKIAMKIYVPNSKFSVALKHDEQILANLEASEENALILQKHELPSTSRDIEVSAQGQGFGVLQIAYQYNVNINDEWPRFILRTEVHGNSNKEFLHLVVCTRFVPDEMADKSNMAVMEVSLPSGFTFDTDSLPELAATEKVRVSALKYSILNFSSDKSFFL